MKEKKKEKAAHSERVLRWVMNAWSILILPFVIANFVTQNHWEYLIVPVAVLYTGFLALFVSSKEFSRWNNNRRSLKKPGEYFVIAWTVVIMTLFAASIIFGPEYTIHTDLVAIYIAVISLYAVTEKSKEFHLERQKQAKRDLCAICDDRLASEGLEEEAEEL